MFIYIARHAWAGQFSDADVANDSLRELTPEGAERYMHIIEALAGREFAPLHIATSPVVRCRQTAEIIAKYAPGQPTLEELDALAPGSDLQALLKWTRHKQADVLWCGHNPDVEDLTSVLVGGGNVRFAKGAIAAVRFHGPIEPSAGELYWHLTAKLLGV